jgi:molybdate transport system substrate-binding protein
MLPRFRRSLRFAIAPFVLLPAAALAQINVITSGGFAIPFAQIAPEFEKAARITVATTRGQSQGGGPNAIAAQLRRGVPADVVIMSREGLDDLIAEGKIVPGSAVNLAQTPLGVSVRAGAPKPDLSTVEAFKQMLLRANSVTFPSSTTGIYMMDKLFPRLGIAAQISAKITHSGIADVANGNADLAIQPVSELLHVSGTDFVGTLPSEIQYISIFSCAVVAGSRHLEEAKRLIAYLQSESAKSAIVNSGMEPLSAR